MIALASERASAPCDWQHFCCRHSRCAALCANRQTLANGREPARRVCAETAHARTHAHLVPAAAADLVPHPREALSTANVASMWREWMDRRKEWMMRMKASSTQTCLKREPVTTTNADRASADEPSRHTELRGLRMTRVKLR